MNAFHHSTIAQGFYSLQSKTIQPSDTLPFVVQPLLCSQQNYLFGYEALYRGGWPIKERGWVEVDLSLLRYLSKFKISQPMFLNLSNETILSIDEEILIAAHCQNHLYLEWSEAVSDDRQFKQITQRINRWAKAGLRFVIDDFGAGRDGLERMFAVEGIAAIKIDAGFFRTASQNAMAQRLLENLILECTHKQILTVAEGIESAGDLALARDMGCHFVQGYFINEVYLTEARCSHNQAA